MDDYFFQYYPPGEEVLWFDDEILPPPPPAPPPPVNQHERGFVKYSSRSLEGFRSKSWGGRGSNDQNVNRRMIQFLKKSCKTPTIGPVEAERGRNHKHMISERMRRMKQKESFEELHKMLPLGTKGDKNSIVQMAAERIQELQKCKEEMKRRKIELELALAAANIDDEVSLEEAKIQLKVAHPSSGIDALLEVLKCLKDTGTKIKAIQSNFSSQEFSAVLHIEAKIGAAEVEKAIHRTLFEVERKFRWSF